MADNTVLAEAKVSAVRRLMAAALLAAVGLVLGRAGIVMPIGSVPGALSVVAGVAVLWLALRLVLAPNQGLQLTATALIDLDGTRIVGLSDIDAIDRGLLAARPSNGFVLRIRTGGGPGWRPGVWWRLGRRVGVGGIVAKAEAKAMADRLADLLAARDQVSDQAS